MGFEGITTPPLLRGELERAPEPAHSLESIRGIAAGDEFREELFDDMHDSAHRYFSSVCKHVHLAGSVTMQQRMEPQEYRQELEVRDRNRRLTHDGLHVATLALARECKKTGKDTRWWKDISGTSNLGEMAGERTRIGDWALKTVFDSLEEENANKRS